MKIRAVTLDDVGTPTLPDAALGRATSCMP